MQCKKYGYEFNGELDFWDMRYYSNLIEETKYSVDKELLKEYFPAKTVIDGSLKIYQQLLGLKFVECCEDVDKWHEEVQLVSFFGPKLSPYKPTLTKLPFLGDPS